MFFPTILYSSSYAPIKAMNGHQFLHKLEANAWIEKKRFTQNHSHDHLQDQNFHRRRIQTFDLGSRAFLSFPLKEKNERKKGEEDYPRNRYERVRIAGMSGGDGDGHTSHPQTPKHNCEKKKNAPD